MDITSIQQLSGLLQGKLHNFTLGDILSSLQALSSLPLHPYEQAKYKLFGKDHKFPTIHDIPIPTDFNYQAVTTSLSAIGDYTHTIGMSALSAAEIKMREAMEQGIAPKKADIENIVIMDEHIIKKNIELTEIVKSLTLNDIETRPVEIAQKILSYYTKMF